MNRCKLNKNPGATSAQEIEQSVRAWIYHHAYATQAQDRELRERLYDFAVALF